jgi:hypothetical protein
MDTILQSLKSISSYPVSQTTLQRVAGCWGLALDGEATSTVLRSKAYNLAEADLKLWLSKAPNVAEGGVTFSFSADERKQFKAEAYSTYQAFDETLITRSAPEYGYQGEDL